MKYLTGLVKNNQRLFIGILLLFAAIAHGYNMYHFPYYENDEGTYMAQAWAVTQGKLATYTYWYDHAPLGWVFIAFWTKLTGGIFAFGTAVNSGRTLMLVLHVAIAYLLYFLGKKMTKSALPGTIAILLFSLSPLAVYFQRRVLLDNIMIFWVLVSLALLYRDKLKLRYIILSAITFGIAVLSKENAIFFIPAMLYAIILNAGKKMRTFAIIKWIAVTGIIISFYFLYALVKGEFFPSGTLLGGSTPHVSLLTTLQEQYSRGGGYFFWEPKSDFYGSFMDWVGKDLYIIVAAIASTLLGLIMSIKVKALRMSTLMVTLFWLFLLRGKLVIDFYIVPLLPLAALQTGLVLQTIFSWLSFKKKSLYYALSACSVILVIILYSLQPYVLRQYTKDETTNQLKTIEWIKHNLPGDSKIIIDDYLYLDLHLARTPGETIYPEADRAWKLEKDPEILVKKYHQDWKNIEYITLGHEILKQIRNDKFPMLKKALENSTKIIEWRENSSSHINMPQYISTNGDWMAMYKVGDRDEIVLNASWRYYKPHFIKSYGQVINPQKENQTTTEGQSSAMLRAVWESDRDTFDGVYAWTKDHFQYRTNDALFSSVWGMKGEKETVLDSESASDGDQDIALALLFAYKRWGDEKYLVDAKRIINDIWRKEVVLVNGHYYLIAGTGAKKNGGYLINPSSYSPASYRIFSQVDPVHPWNVLAADTYYFLNRVGNEGVNNLPKNWVYLTGNGALQSAAGYKRDADYYGHDGYKTLWRVGLDKEWYNSSQARSYLEKTAVFFAKEWEDQGKIAAVYDLSGKSIADDSSLSTNIGALTALRATNSKAAAELYKKQYDGTFNFDDGYWKEGKNYAEQNWAWFGAGLYNKRLINLWETKTIHRSQ